MNNIVLDNRIIGCRFKSVWNDDFLYKIIRIEKYRIILKPIPIDNDYKFGYIGEEKLYDFIEFEENIQSEKFVFLPEDLKRIYRKNKIKKILDED